MNDFEPCGAIHPNYPNLVCMRTGKCRIDDHIGKLDRRDRDGRRWTEVVTWGTAVMPSRFRVIPIRQDAPGRKEP